MRLAFDFDGTICASQDAFLEIGNKYCQENHLEMITFAAARKIGLKGIISHYHLTPLQVIKIIFWGRTQLVATYPSLPLISGIIPVLEELSIHHTLNLITSTPLNLVTANLKEHQIDHFFSEIVAGVDLYGKSHKLKKHPADYYIGDETRDIEAAQSAGCKSIAVTWGFEEESLLKLSHPDFLIHQPSDLLQISY
jgi:phosphoglycolate phosphatase